MLCSPKNGIGCRWSPILLTALTLLAIGIVDAQEASLNYALDDSGNLVQFQRDVAPIFQRYCADCHLGDEAKADFNINEVDTVLSYVEPESVDDSSLFTDYLAAEDEDMLMPPRSHGGPMPPADLALIRVWIQEGAAWPEGASVSADAEIVASVAAASPPPLLGRVWMAQGFLHPATVHFPIALLLLGGAFVVIGWKFPAVGTQIPLACLLLGAITSVAATGMGWAFAVERGYGSWARFDAEMMDREVFWHRWSAVIVTVTACLFALIALWSLRKPSNRLTTVWKGGLLACAAMVGAVGHQGGEMSYGEDFYPKAWRTLIGQPESTGLDVNPPTLADETV